MKNDRIATFIKIAIVFTVIPRWTPALLMAEGFKLPESWLSWWLPLSAFFNTGMAITEAVAISYVFSAWNNSSGKHAKRLLTMTVFMLIAFSIVLIPFAAASISEVGMQDILRNPSQYWVSMIWSTAIVLSTSITVMAVGVAQGSKDTNKTSEFACFCGREFETQDELDNHQEVHLKEVVKEKTAVNGLNLLKDRYGLEYEHLKERKGIPPFPSLLDIAKIQNSEEQIENE